MQQVVDTRLKQPNIMKAKKKKIESLKPEDLGIDLVSDRGASLSLQAITKYGVSTVT